MSQQKNKPRLRLRLFYFFLIRFHILVGPLCTVLIVNKDRYFTSVAEGVGIAVGGAICLLFVALLLLGVIKAPGALYMFGLVFLLSYLMEPILSDLFLLSGIAFCSKLVDFVVFAPLVRATKARIAIEKTAKTTAVEVESVLKAYVGRV